MVIMHVVVICVGRVPCRCRLLCFGGVRFGWGVLISWLMKAGCCCIYQLRQAHREQRGGSHFSLLRIFESIRSHSRLCDVYVRHIDLVHELSHKFMSVRLRLELFADIDSLEVSFAYIVCCVSMCNYSDMCWEAMLFYRVLLTTLGYYRVVASLLSYLRCRRWMVVWGRWTS